jgi:hypothetical protein
VNDFKPTRPPATPVSYPNKKMPMSKKLDRGKSASTLGKASKGKEGRDEQAMRARRYAREFWFHFEAPVS